MGMENHERTSAPSRPTSIGGWGVLALAIPVALSRLLPFLPWNFKPVDGLCLYVGARYHSWRAYLVPLGVMPDEEWVSHDVMLEDGETLVIASDGVLDLIGDGTGIFTFTPSGAEKVAELYYRFRISPQFDVSPDFQWIGRPGANSKADSVKVVGVRANVAF